MSIPAITPVILAGGSGTRLWPASRKLKPKQFLALTHSEFSLFQLTLLRASRLEGVESPIVICNEEHRFLVAEQMLELDINAKAIILEPEGKNTAPAATLAALACEHQDSMLLVLPADHLIQKQEEFLKAVDKACQLALSGRIVTFALVPQHAETGYGYIKKGKPLGELGYKVDAFIEKPDSSTAESLLASGQYYWNSGMFCFSAAIFLEELARFEPDILSTCQDAMQHALRDMDFTRLGHAYFSPCPSNSIDYAIMEKTDRAALVSFNPEWSDIGAWDALWKSSSLDENNNSYTGDVFCQNTHNSLIHASHRLVTTLGIDNLVVVETADAVLVADKNASQQIKLLVEQLKLEQRSELDSHSKVYRPWGWYESICMGERFQVKRILVKPKASLSLQKHQFRAEHWVVVKGQARVTNGNEEHLYHEDQSTYIPIGNIHRLENPGDKPLEIIEIQTGSYLGEDDITRIEDDYGRL